MRRTGVLILCSILTVSTISPWKTKEVNADWTSFRGEDNNGVTDARIPINHNEAQLYWSVKAGEGYAGAAPGTPIIIGDEIIYTAGDQIVKRDKFSGELLQTGDMKRASSYNITSPVYAEGKIFVGLAKGTIQAFDAVTLESLWVYEDELGGQANSQIMYQDGYIYTGFWNTESTDANFVCIDVADEDTTDSLEQKTAKWIYTSKGGFYWAGAIYDNGHVIFGTENGVSGDTEKSTLMVCDAQNGTVIDAYYGINGDIRSSICYDEETNRYYFTSKEGYLNIAQIDNSGIITDVDSINLGGQSTSTPVVVNGRAYVGVRANAKSESNMEHHISVIDLKSKTVAYTLSTNGYPQTSGLATIAYGEYTYVYFVENCNPGKIRMLKDKPGMTEAEIVRESEYGDSLDNNVLFTPKGEHANYGICSLVCDEEGTLYYKNDSAYIMAIGSKVVGIEIIKQPDKTHYQTGEAFDPAGMEVTAHLANGMDRDITNYVKWNDNPMDINTSAIEVVYDKVGYNDDSTENSDLLSQTVFITVERKEAAAEGAKAVELINNIGVVNLEAKQRVEEARRYYDSLEIDAAGYVVNYSILVESENSIAQSIKKYWKSNPLKISLSKKNGTEIDLSWNKDKYADSYRIYRSEKTSGKYKRIAETANNSFTDRSTCYGVKYFYKVVPVIKYGIEGSVTDEGYGKEKSISVVPDKTKKVTLKKQKNNKIRIIWSRVKNVSGYEIYRSTKKNKAYKLVARINSAKTVKYVDKSADNSSGYYYKIRAFRTVKGKRVYGQYSTVKYIKTKR